MRLVFTYCNH